MENKIMMPACYNVMTEEEMTYTQGGATTLEAVCAWIVPGYGYFRMISDARAECKANENGWLDRLLEKKVADSQGSIINAAYNIGCAVWTVVPMVASMGVGALLAAVDIYV